jgi:class 3 adenylate cyclase/tetratricopeptide (TPR) repeat protein
MASVDHFGWTGSTIDGRFRIESVAGEGAFGVVYRGRHLAFDEAVAVKCLKIPVTLKETERGRFLAAFHEEARLLLRLSRQTTSIVQPFDFGAATAPSGAWTPYIVMEWLEGHTLDDAIAIRAAHGAAPSSLAEAIDLLAPAASALAVAHDLGVAHRDVKPSNVFLASEERRAVTTKLLDFGIAKVLTESASITHALARSGEAVRAFTPQYAAPEQFSPRFGPTGPWTDVFALALVFIEVVTGRTALPGGDAIQLFVASCDEAARPSLARNGVVADAAVEAALAKALAVQPANRWRNARELWKAIEATRGSALARTTSSLPTSIVPAAPAVPRFPSSLAPDGADMRITAPEENRLCTVVFADIAGFAALSERLDAEQVKEIVDSCFQALASRIERLGGWVDKFMGDGIMAVFGVPRADDGDAERAVRAALDMQAALAEVTARSRLLRKRPLSMRIGINTGRVFAGRVGGAKRRDYTVIGDAVNIAARLQEHAPEGTIVVGRDTQRLITGLFDLEPLPPVEVKGKTERLAASRVVGVARPRTQLPPTDFYGLPTKLFGRTAEMVRLLEALDACAADRRAALLTIAGPSGVGRSRLLAELASAAAARAEPPLTLAAHASSLSTTSSYALVSALLRGGFGLEDGDAPQLVATKIRNALDGLRPTTDQGEPPMRTRENLERVSTDLATLVGTTTPTTGGDSLSPDERWSQAKNRVAAALAEVLGAVGSRCPLVILCDDAQWADDASLDLFDELVVRLVDAPVLVVLAARPEFFERRPHWGEGKTAHGRLDVAPLARRHIEALARDRLREAEAVPAELLSSLVDRAEGNPLILQEMLHLLVDAGAIEPRPGQRWMVRPERWQGLALPATIQGIVQARLDRLDADAREVLARAAVVGRTFWEGAVAHLGADDSSAATEWAEPGSSYLPAPLPKATQILAHLRERQLVRLRDVSRLPGERELVFADGATQEVAYETLSARLRRSLHLRVAAWLSERAPEDASAALLALHYQRGGDVARAAREYARAAAHAASLGQNAEALRHYQHVCALHDAHVDAAEDAVADSGGFTPEPEEARVASWRDRARVRLEIGDVQRRLGRLDEAERSYDEAGLRVLRVERRRGGSLEASEPLRWDAALDFRMALVHRVRGSTATARELVERAIRVAESAGAADETPGMWAVLAALFRREGDLDACRRAAIEGLRACRRARARDVRWRESVSHLLGALGAVFYSRKQLVRAERLCRQAVRAVDEIESGQAAGIARNMLAAVLFAKQDWPAARAVFLDSLALKEREGDLQLRAIAHNNLAEVELRIGDASAALRHAEKSVRGLEQLGATTDLPDALRNLAEALAANGRAVEALAAAERSVALAREGAGRVYLGDAAVALARVASRVLNTPELEVEVRQRAYHDVELLRALLPELGARAEECGNQLATLAVDLGSPR